MQQYKKKMNWISATGCIILVLFCVVLFYHDNKYQTPPPYGKSGILEIQENDIADKPIYLIDGWLLSDKYVTDLPTYIGEYSNLQRNDISISPHGKATYRLTLRYSGAPLIMEIDFPKIFTEYTVSIDGKELDSGSGSTRVIFPLKQGEQTLTVQTASKDGYYSGLYFPPVLGKPELLSQIQNIQSFSYALAFLTPLVLAVFTFSLWRQKSDPTTFWFGSLCCFYVLYISHYFICLYQLPFQPYWNFVEGFALYGLIFCLIQLTALSADMIQSKIFKYIRFLFLVIPLFLMTLYLYIPIFPQAVALHGAVKNIYFIFTFCSVLLLAIRAALYHSFEYGYIIAGCVVFGLGLMLNLFFSNRFEPILFLWQFEWCGLFLVLLFGSMMSARNRRIIDENIEFSHHLEQLVDKRTEELSLLLSERKAFFADMAHDLKAPLFATQAFIRAIRQNSTCVDKELIGYIDAVEQKQREMANRIQGLSVINKFDKIASKKEFVSIKELMNELYASHNGEAEVSSIHMLIKPPDIDGYIFAQSEKLDILFENLIYNAIKATPPDGHIIISAVIIEKCVYFNVDDSGCGIQNEELVHIFDRFYVGANNKSAGTGLGLYIVKSIVTELEGEISVTSQLGVGTKFTIQLPIV